MTMATGKLHWRRRGDWLAILVGAAPLLLLIDDFRYFIESRMLFHMLVEFPLLFASGAVIGARSSQAARVFEAVDYRGFTGVTLMLCVSTYWMIPSSLDSALLYPMTAFWKYVSWWAAGCLLAMSWRRLDDVLLMFLFGNLCWMLASAGLLYESSSSRLCVNYLFGDQQTTGRALVALAIAMGALLMHRIYQSSVASSASP
ncbi:MAG: hypothetical protein ABW110_01610 [Steroidobacteraceae bacterium]